MSRVMLKASETAPRQRLLLNDTSANGKARPEVRSGGRLQRVRLEQATDNARPGGRYFDREPSVEFFSSGCKLLDLALGGGWVSGRVSNVVGDRSSGKTLTAIEGMANFARKYPDPSTHLIRYYEVEDAFDDGYAEMLGMPLKRVSRGGQSADTVNDFEQDLESWLKKIPKGGGGFYALDSLDALGSEDEQVIQRDPKTGKEKGSYGMDRAKKMSRMFRRLVRKIGRANVHLMIISQLRDKINVTFGEKHTRAGGKALDFYASHIVWLAELGKIKVTRSGIKRPIGIQVKARVKKNKVGLPYREVEYPMLFAYGMDDVQAALDWLDEVGYIGELGLTSKGIDAFMKDFHKLPPAQAQIERKRINKVLKPVWYDIERTFLPPQGKY